ncbi:hypothetical protein [Caulobacter sp.]|uniref:hypothetical protein n=1 Tax=Caulobacter sp. TaxID=78 RepID=UPI003BABD1F1
MRFKGREFAGYLALIWLRTGPAPRPMPFALDERDEEAAMDAAYESIIRNKSHYTAAGLEVRTEVWALHMIDEIASTGHPEQFVGAWCLSRDGNSMRVHSSLEYIDPKNLWKT